MIIYIFSMTSWFSFRILTKNLFILQNIGIWQNYGVNFIQKWNRIQLRTSYFHPAIFLRQKLYKNSIAQKGKKFWVLEEIESGEDWELCAPLLHKQKHIKQKKSRLFHLLTVSLTAAMHSGTWCKDTLSVNKQDWKYCVQSLCCTMAELLIANAKQCQY